MKIGALIVLYQPDKEMIGKVIDCLLQQVDEICVVDNSDHDNSTLISASKDKIQYIFMNGNKGIAAAQNRGIDYFIKQNFDYIISCDQDTLIDITTITKLTQTMLDLQQAGVKVAAVAPIGIDHYTHQPLSYKIETIGKKEIAGHELLEVTHTMNSMSLIPTQILKEIGGMEEELFIDAVDCEWGWRAKKLIGARSFCDTEILMNHSLGIGAKQIAGVYRIHITPASRMYYQYRNYLWLVRRQYTPWKWIYINALKYIAKVFFYTIKGPDRRSYIIQIMRGIRDGIRGKQK